MSAKPVDTPNLMSLHGGLQPGVSPPRVTQLNPEDMTPQERLKYINRRIRDTMGADYDPILELAMLAQQCVEAGDHKTAVTALNGVADRMYPKLKALEISSNSDVPLVIEGTVTQKDDGATTPAAGDKRFPFE